jgi:hypothetical protein
MQGIYNYIPETNHVSTVYSVEAAFELCATCNVISPAKYVLYFYIIIIIIIIIMSWGYKVVLTTLCYLKGKGTCNRPEDLERGRGIALLFPGLGARRGWVVSTTPRPLCTRERPGTHCVILLIGKKIRKVIKIWYDRLKNLLQILETV